MALAKAQRPLVYGGGAKGIMGIVSKSCLDAGGQVTGVMPYAMVMAGGEKEKTGSPEKSNEIHDALNERRVSSIICCIS